MSSSSCSNIIALTLPTLGHLNYDKNWGKPLEQASRPLNSFILFRQWHADNARAHDSEEGSSSMTVSKLWAEQPDNVKAHWAMLAEKVKMKHKERYPGYIYQPKTAKTKSERKENTRPYPSHPSTSKSSTHKRKSVKEKNGRIKKVGRGSRGSEKASNCLEDTNPRPSIHDPPSHGLLGNMPFHTQYRCPISPGPLGNMRADVPGPHHGGHASANSTNIQPRLGAVHQLGTEWHTPQLLPTESLPQPAIMSPGEVVEDKELAQEGYYTRPSNVVGFPSSLGSPRYDDVQSNQPAQTLEPTLGDDGINWDEWLNSDV